MFPDIDPLVRFFGVGTALLGVGYAVFEKDTKRMLAFHTVSQLGFVLAAPEVGGFYALTHGLVKSALFLAAGNLPSRNLKVLHHEPMSRSVWVALAIASFSISGFPLLSGFGAKVLTMKNLLPWQVVGMNVAALGTAISFAKFIFLPSSSDDKSPVKPGFWAAMVLLLGGAGVCQRGLLRSLHPGQYRQTPGHHWGGLGRLLRDLSPRLAQTAAGGGAVRPPDWRHEPPVDVVVWDGAGMIGYLDLILRLVIWFLLTADLSPANIIIGVCIALILPRNRTVTAVLRDWLHVMWEIIAAIPTAYAEAIEIIFRPHTVEDTVMERVKPNRTPGLIFLDIFLITFTPKTIVLKYHEDGWYEVHRVRRPRRRQVGGELGDEPPDAPLES